MSGSVSIAAVGANNEFCAAQHPEKAVSSRNTDRRYRRVKHFPLLHIIIYFAKKEKTYYTSLADRLRICE